jgi:hypothetical protein
MATEPKPDLPSADECVRRAWHALHVTDEHPGYPFSTLQTFYAESQAWSLLALALAGGPSARPARPMPIGAEPSGVQSVPQPPTPAPVARRKPGSKPKEPPTSRRASANDIVARLKAEWEQESDGPHPSD